MKTSIKLLLILVSLAIILPAKAQEHEIPMLDNPMSEKYIKKNLRKSHPRLVYNASILKNLKKKMKTDPVLQNMYKAIKLNADEVFEKELLTRKKEGKRLLGVSREMLWRINSLGFVYLMEKDKKVLDRINEEVIAVCNFSDWNPSHFLDVAEMSAAVAFAIDWTAGELPKSTIDLAIKALIEKGINPSWREDGTQPGWAYGHNNWNQVCNGGMIAASVAIAEKDPALAAKTLHRALDGLPSALSQYSPDGVYPEGSTYWSYGTSYSVLAAAMLESSFGTDFGHLEYPAYKESAMYRALMNTPSGWYFNFADCGDQRSENGDIVLAWFGAKTGNKTFFETQRFLRPAEEMGKLSRLAGASMAWLSQYEEKGEEKMPTAWKGDGSNPIVVFKGDENDPHTYYFGGKGGRATTSHGNMDAGSFIFELNGVRWSIDPGNQGYHDLEKTGFNLWSACQDCERWTLLTKNNYGHSTITVNNELFINNATATLEEFKTGKNPEATFNMAPIYGENIKSATRKFLKDSDVSVVIEDNIEVSEKTDVITWQMMTVADVEFVEGGAILRQDGKELKLENLSHPELDITMVSLYPAPLKLDRQIEGLKRLEIRIPAWTVEAGKVEIKVRLSGE